MSMGCGDGLDDLLTVVCHLCFFTRILLRIGVRRLGRDTFHTNTVVQSGSLNVLLGLWHHPIVLETSL